MDRRALVVVFIAFFISFLTIAEGGEAGWPCCDKCGICTKTIPPKCTCNDNLLLECPSSCKKCVKSPLEIFPQRYICKDLIVNYCDKKCHPDIPLAY